jgi:hypothetical protein
MSSAELKLNIFRLIDQIEDQDKLSGAYRSLLALPGSKNPAHSELFHDLEESLAISEAQVKEGKTIPHEEVMRKYRDKYSKQ